MVAVSLKKKKKKNNNKNKEQKKVWGYYDENNQLVLTRGVKATMPVLKAEQKIIEDYKNVVKKVFG